MLFNNTIYYGAQLRQSLSVEPSFSGQELNAGDTHGSWADPEILLLNILHTLIHPFVPQHLKNKTNKQKIKAVT